jgi:hypothetical protein
MRFPGLTAMESYLAVNTLHEQYATAISGAACRPLPSALGAVATLGYWLRRPEVLAECQVVENGWARANPLRLSGFYPDFRTDWTEW